MGTVSSLNKFLTCSCLFGSSHWAAHQYFSDGNDIVTPFRHRYPVKQLLKQQSNWLFRKDCW